MVWRERDGWGPGAGSYSNSLGPIAHLNAAICVN